MVARMLATASRDTSLSAWSHEGWTGLCVEGLPINGLLFGFTRSPDPTRCPPQPLQGWFEGPIQHLGFPSGK